MLRGLRLKVGLSYSRLHFRDDLNRITNFTNALKRAHRALVIFPESSSDSESVSTLLSYLQRRYSTDGMTVLIRDDQLSTITTAQKLKTLTYSSDDINSWFLPRRKLIKRMKRGGYDVALDLNIDLSLPGAYLCKVSNAPLRVSFAKPEGDQFYNFQIKTDTTINKTNSYKSLLKCLDMF